MLGGVGAVPPRSYKSVSLKLEVYERLEALARSRGLSSANDVIVMLLEVYEVCRATQLAQAQAGSQSQGERKPSLADILGLR
jgi:predicted CopG family antitoxin